MITALGMMTILGIAIIINPEVESAQITNAYSKVIIDIFALGM